MINFDEHVRAIMFGIIGYMMPNLFAQKLRCVKLHERVRAKMNVIISDMTSSQNNKQIGYTHLSAMIEGREDTRQVTKVAAAMRRGPQVYKKQT